MVVIAGDFNGHIGSNAEDYGNQPGGYGYGVKNEEGQRILEFFAAMVVGYTLFKKRASHLVTYESRPSKVDYCLVRRDQMKFLKDMKIPRCEECVTQH